jgi:hypothetical protein
VDQAHSHHSEILFPSGTAGGLGKADGGFETSVCGIGNSHGWTEGSDPTAVCKLIEHLLPQIR